MKVGEGTGSKVGHATRLCFDPLALKSIPIDDGLGADPPELTFVYSRVINNSITRISRHCE